MVMRKIPRRPEPSEDPVIIRVRGIVNRFGDNVLHDNIDLEVRRGEVLAIVGGSGAGKSVFLRSLIGLNRPAEGRVEVFGEDIHAVTGSELKSIQMRWGVLFQEGALFSSFTVAENIAIPLREYTRIPEPLLAEIALVKIAMVGLPPDAAWKRPSELSGGMKKRAGLARALALDPEIVFLDEPTAGLDPISASQFDALLLELQRSLKLTVVMVTHDLDTLIETANRVAVLVDKKLRVGTLEEVRNDPNPWIQSYFKGLRGRAALDGRYRVETGD